VWVSVVVDAGSLPHDTFCVLGRWLVVGLFGLVGEWCGFGWGLLGIEDLARFVEYLFSRAFLRAGERQKGPEWVFGVSCLVGLGFLSEFRMWKACCDVCGSGPLRLCFCVGFVCEMLVLAVVWVVFFSLG